MDKKERQVKFGLLQRAIKLSNQKIADWFEVDLLTVKRWRNGTSIVPISVIISMSYRAKHGDDYEVDLSGVSLKEPTHLTRSIILDAVCKETGVKSEYVDLELLHEGGSSYVWTGKAGACFRSCEAYRTLNSVTLQRWTEDFISRLEDWHFHESGTTELDIKKLGNKFNKYIESLDWTVE